MYKSKIIKHKFLVWAIILIQILALITSGALAAFGAPATAAAQAAAPGGVTTDLALWLRSSDENFETLPEVPGFPLPPNPGEGPIVAWLDLSPNGYHAVQDTEVFRPDFGAGLNFHPTVQFDGVNDFMAVPGGTLRTVTNGLSTPATFDAVTVFLVHRYDNALETKIFAHIFEESTSDMINWGAVSANLHRWGLLCHGYTGMGGHGDSLCTPAGLLSPDTPYLWSLRYKNRAAREAILNGLSRAADATGPDLRGGGADFVIGRGPTGPNYNFFYSGEIAELIVYTTDLTPAQRRNVESYLALEWGLTLGDSSTPISYTSSSGVTVWDGPANSAYHHDVAGIGRDDGSALEQKQSQSVNTGALVTMGLGAIAADNASNPNSFAADVSFLVWGNDAGATTVGTAITGLTGGQRMDRIWKTQETAPSGAPVGSVLVQIPTSAIPLGANEVAMLIRSADTTFNSSDTYVLLTTNGANYEASIDFANGNFFSFAKVSTADNDGDGVPDYQELLDGTDPNDPNSHKDTDGDGVPDYVEQQDGTNPNDPNSYKDSDGDLVPDYIENKFGADPNDPTTYPDGDGDLVPDYIEQRDGTDPADPNSFKDTDGGGVPDYVEVTLYPNVGLPAGDPNNPADDQRDTDGGGVSDYDEINLGADPLDPADDSLDSDGDGVPDAIELLQGTDPNDPTSYRDSDGDGVPDWVEQQDGADPNDPNSFKDSDGDGVPDYVETHKDGADPTDKLSYKDSDGDGVPDYIEQRDGADPNDPFSYKDSDGDLVPDYIEQRDGANPNDPTSFKDTDGGGVPDYVETVLYPNQGLPASDPNDPSDDNRDSDGGSVSDYDELKLGTDPLNPADDDPDSDGDGVPDSIELAQGTDPNDPLSYLDSDGDGVPDYIENWDGTDPNDPLSYKDSDGDFVPDYIEQRDGTNPNDANDFKDSDGDGVPDYVETVLYPNAGLPAGDPNDPSDGQRDTDNGGVTDYEELKRGADPKNPADDNVMPGALVVLAPTRNGSTNDTTPTFIGTGAPGDTITVSENGAVLCTAVVDQNGDWRCTPASPLSKGPHTVIVTATDPAGAVTGMAVHPFTINPGKVSTAVMINPKPAELVNSDRPTFSGLADPSNTVIISEGGRVLCTAVADQDGVWSCTSTVSLPDGVTTITMTATDPAGNDSIPGVRSFVIDATPPDAPVVTSPTDGSTTSSTPTFTGAAEPGSTVTVRDENGAVLCTALVAPLGQWQCTSTVPLDEGEHTITFTATDKAGNVSEATTVRFTVDGTASIGGYDYYLPFISRVCGADVNCK